MKKFRRGTVILAAVFLAFLSVANLNFMKGKIEQAASSALEDDVVIKGDIYLGMTGIWPALVMNDVQMGVEKKTDVYQADRLEIGWSFPKKLLVSVDNLRLNGNAMGSYTAPVILRSDGFNIREIEDTVLGGRLKGDITYRAGKLDVDVNIVNFDYAQFAKGIRGGKIGGKIKLTGAGDDTDAIVRSLAGDIQFFGEEGRLSGGAVELWAADLLTSVLSGPQKETKLNCVVADFDVRQGVLRSRAVLFDTERVTVRGKGNIDLGEARIKMTFTPKPKKPALLSLATAVNVSGPFDDITVTPQPADVAKKLGGFLLGAINPAAGLLPLLKSGTGSKNPCLKYMESPETE